MSKLADPEAEACRQLWVAVLVTAARDILLGNPNRLEAQQARAWLGSRDFRDCCARAGVCPRRFQAGLEGRRGEFAQLRKLALENGETANLKLQRSKLA